ncbi:hypothetical protein WICPIJ_009590 [Wickerhamomyces pijperi]|uniref:U3 small nucleolar RNA-associated protein 11 n=1 Tax=Wickerhamomyces pijperi TaxID=599730 RepID=A0A9P8TCP9_WICPI|nr:hypothetical protein WICPIJ_009590 [Wickerhamomyces pijperi]
MAKLVHNVQKKQHRERSQPGERAKYGLLEKKKDYKLRAEDFHKKQATLKSMKAKIATHNPDEYYHGMVNKKTDSRGILISERDTEVLSTAQVKLLKTQDLSYIKNITNEVENKIKKSQKSLLFESKGNHTVFVDSVEEKKSFDASKHFETDKRLMSNKANRLRTTQLLAKTETPEIDQAKLDSMERKKAKKLNALKANLNKLEKLKEVELRMNYAKDGMSNGNKVKIVDSEGRTAFKFKKQRKR